MTVSKMNKMLIANAKQAKKLFDLCEKHNEGIYNKLHLIDNSRFPEERKEYRIYHADGYCFDVTKEKIELAEDEFCASCINGFEYSFNEGAFDGFKEINIEQAIKFLEEI